MRSGFGFFDQAQGGVVEVAQLGFARFVTSKFDEVATIEEFAKAFLLVGREQIGFAEFIKKLLSCTFGRVEAEALFEIAADGVRY